MAVASPDGVSPFLELKEDCSRAAIFASRDDMVSVSVAMVIAVGAGKIWLQVAIDQMFYCARGRKRKRGSK